MVQPKFIIIAVVLIFGLGSILATATDGDIVVTKNKYRPFQRISFDDGLQDYVPDVSDEDLGYFYNFCSMLPRLEALGKIPKNEKTQTMCKKLRFVLNPMYDKTALKDYKWL